MFAYNLSHSNYDNVSYMYKNLEDKTDSLNFFNTFIMFLLLNMYFFAEWCNFRPSSRSAFHDILWVLRATVRRTPVPAMGIPYFVFEICVRRGRTIHFRIRQGKASVREAGLLPFRLFRQVSWRDGHETLRVLHSRVGAHSNQYIYTYLCLHSVTFSD